MSILDSISLLLKFFKVLIIGGGDGGIARECAKHPMVKSVTQCEIDGVRHFLVLIIYTFFN